MWTQNSPAILPLYRWNNLKKHKIISFYHTIPHGRQKHVYPIFSKPRLLLTWRRSEDTVSSTMMLADFSQNCPISRVKQCAFQWLILNGIAHKEMVFNGWVIHHLIMISCISYEIIFTIYLYQNWLILLHAKPVLGIPSDTVTQIIQV